MTTVGDSARPARRALPSGLVDPDALPFAGRAAELEQLIAMWEEAAALGSRRVVAVGGDAGIGKTRLLAELAAAAHTHGDVVLGRSDHDGFVPHQPVAEIMAQLVERATDDPRLAAVVDRHREALGWLVPRLAADADPRPEGDERVRLVAACTAVLRAAAERGPMLVVVDDAHWAPAATVALLRQLLRAVEGAHSVLFAFGYRIEEAGPTTPLGMLLADLRREPDVSRISLSGLDVETVGDLILRTGAASTERPTADAVHAATDGNPFLIGELLRHLDDEGGRAPGGALLVLEHRLAELPDATRHLLAIAAVLGAELDLETLQALHAPDDGDLIDALDVAVDRRVLREVEHPSSRYRFVHTLARDAVLAALGPTRLARLHQRVGEVLEAAAGSSLAAQAQAAHHLVQSNRPEVVERGARTALEVAGSMTYSTEAGDAAALAVRAADALEAEPGHDIDLVVDLLATAASAYVNQMRQPEFAAAASRAVAAARRSGAPRALAVAAAARGWYNPTSEPDDSILDDALEALERIDPSEEQLRARLHTGAAIGIITAVGDQRAAVEHGLQAIALADRAGDRIDRWQARFATSHARNGEADVAPALALGAEVEALALDEDDQLVAHGRRITALAQLQLGDLDGFVRTIAACNEVWEACGYTLGIALGIHARVLEATARGRFEEAEAITAEIVERLPMDRYHSATYAAQLIAIRWLQGRLGELEGFVGMTAAAYPELPSLQTCHGLALAEVDRLDEARAICRARPHEPRMFAVDFLLPVRLAWGIELAVTTGEVDQLPALLAAFTPYGGQLTLFGTGVSLLGPSDHYLAVGAAALGDRDEAARRFAAALALEERLGLTPFIERTHRWMARLAD